MLNGLRNLFFKQEAVLEPRDGPLRPVGVEAIDLSNKGPLFIGPGDHELAVAGDQPKLGRIVLR